MKSFFGKLSARFPFFANRPSALEHAVQQSPKSRRLRMEPLENRALLAVDAFGGAASLIDSDVGENWGPDPAPAAFSASVLATDAAIVDVSGVNATLDAALFSVQAETPEPVAPPSFDQLMESFGMIEIESLDDESDVASASYLDEAASTTQLLNSLNLQDISQGEPRQVVFYDSSAADFDESTLNLDDESVYYVDAANANDDGAESYSATPRSGGGSSNSGGGSNSGGATVSDPSDCHLTTYGSPVILECATFTGSGGSDQGPYFGFSTPSIPSGYIAYVSFEGGDAEYGKDYVVTMATTDENGVVTPNTDYVSGGKDSNDVYNVYVYGQATYSVVPLNDFAFEPLEEVVAKLYLVDVMSGGADYDPTPILCDNFIATIYQAPEFITEGDDIYAVNTDVDELEFKYGKPKVGDVVTGGFNIKTNERPVTYSLAEPSEYFEINTETGAISWKALPEDQTYNFTLTVKATDSDYSQLCDTLQLSFTYGWASFVLCVDGSDSNSGSGSSFLPGHAFWIIEATSSLTEYCRVEYNAANSITVTIDSNDYSYSFANVEDNIGCALGFYPEDRDALLDIAGSAIFDPVPGAIDSDTATLAEVDAFASKTIPSKENFVEALAYVERKRVAPDDYQLKDRNCIVVAHTVAQIAGVSFQTSFNTELVYTPDDLCDELLDASKPNNGKQGPYTLGNSLKYEE